MGSVASCVPERHRHGPPQATNHVECTADEPAAAGIPDGLLRVTPPVLKTYRM